MIRPGRLFLVLGIALSEFSCSRAVVPTAGQVRAHGAVEPFLVKDTGLIGIYVNYDVDAIVFRYSTSFQNPGQFWKELDTQLQPLGWHAVHDGQRERRYERTLSRPSFTSLEHVRVVYLADPPGTVIVGYVQADERRDVPFAETGEARWAEQMTWPLLEQSLE